MRNILNFLKVLGKIPSIGLGRGLRVYGLVSDELINWLGSNGFKIESGAGVADVLLIDSSMAGYDEVLRIASQLKDSSIALILNLGVNIHRFAGITEDLIESGYVKSWIPLDGAALMVSRRGFSRGFIKSTIEVYRNSFIHGPNPIHYNTAYALYSLTKFTASRIKGLIAEVGTGLGFSTAWMAKAAAEVGSKITSIDARCDRVSKALNHLRGLGVNAEVICADAKKFEWGSPIALAFIDALKSEYHLYLKRVEEYLRPGSLIIAHNTLSSSREVKEYLRIVYGGKYHSITVPTDPAGITASTYLGG